MDSFSFGEDDNRGGAWCGSSVTGVIFGYNLRQQVLAGRARVDIEWQQLSEWGLFMPEYAFWVIECVKSKMKWLD